MSKYRVLHRRVCVDSWIHTASLIIFSLCVPVCTIFNRIHEFFYLLCTNNGQVNILYIDLICMLDSLISIGWHDLGWCDLFLTPAIETKLVQLLLMISAQQDRGHIVRLQCSYHNENVFSTVMYWWDIYYTICMRCPVIYHIHHRTYIHYIMYVLGSQRVHKYIRNFSMNDEFYHQNNILRRSAYCTIKYIIVAKVLMS